MWPTHTKVSRQKRTVLRNTKPWYKNHHFPMQWADDYNKWPALEWKIKKNEKEIFAKI